MIVRPLLAVAALGLGSLAAAISPVTASEPILGRVGSVSEADILREFGGMRPGGGGAVGAIERILPKAGRYVKWGGGLVLGASLVYEGINWYINEVSAEAGGPLKSWWNGSGTFPNPMDFTYYGDRKTASGGPVCQGFSSNGTPMTVFKYLPDNWYAIASRGSNGVVGVAPYGPSSTQACSELGPAPTLAEAAQAMPGLPREVATAVTRYIQNHPEVIRPLLQPSANENQWTDNPYANPTLDTDGDGFSDSTEFESSDGDTNDPTKQPQGSPYETGRNTVVTRNPDGSVTTTSTVTYSDGKTSTSSTTTGSTTTINPDGSTTTRTTTTTTNTDRDGKSTTRTTTNDRTIPANAPSPLPPGSPSPYTGPAPHGDEDHDGIPNDADRSPYGPGGIPSAPVPSSPVDPSNTPHPGDPDYSDPSKDPDPTKDPSPDKDPAKCSLAGGVIDAGHCVPDPKKDRDKDPAACGLAGGVITDGRCGPDPKKDPDKDPAACGLAGGVITDGRCGPDPKKDRDKDPAACGLAGGVITDGRCRPDPKKDPDKDPAKCALLGGTIQDGHCAPDPNKDKKECEKQEGKSWNSQAGTCGDKKDDKPLSNECGDFSVPRLVKYTGPYLHDVVFPCPNDDMSWTKVLDNLGNKFPFSIISSMNNITNIGSSGDSASNSLPTAIGPFTLDFSFANVFFTFIRVAFRAVIWFLFMRWLLSRVSGQVTLN